MKFFFISIFLILTTISFSSYSKEEKGIINSFLKEELEDFELSKEKQNVSDLKFKDNEGKEISFSDFQDKVLLVNFWASWCAPCIKEMPSLDRLKSKIKGNFDVVAISVDRDGVSKVTDFFNNHKIKIKNISTRQWANIIIEKNLMQQSWRRIGPQVTIKADNIEKIINVCIYVFY